MNLIMLTVGVVVGWILHYVFVKSKNTAGTFVIDFSDPLKDVCRIELDNDINALYSKKYITLKVKVYEDLSHD